MSGHAILLSTERLRVGYVNAGRENVLYDQLNLQLPAGRLVCFMGPNGVGKSSLIRTLAGLQKPLGGEIKIHSQSFDQMAVVLTDKVQAANMTVYDLVSFGRYPYTNWSVALSRDDHEQIVRAMHLAHVDHLESFPIHELSDGQLQMVMIARALAQDTPLILLDEPTAHLDLNNRVEIMKLLKKLSRTVNKSILVSTHELDLALQMADWIWLSGNRKDIITGIPEDLVLAGAFDAIFQFKGFDLKTGKVQHEADKGIIISVNGEGYPLLWTRNALERNGFEVVESRADVRISIMQSKSGIQWVVVKPGGEKQCSSLSEVLKYL